MKKNNRKNPYEDESDPMRGLGMELEEDDDDVIELEDIIEMPDRPIDEEEDLDLDVEIFDADQDLESSPARSMRKPAAGTVKPGARAREEVGLLESLAADADEEEENLFEPAVSKSRGKSSAPGAESAIFDDQDDDESILDDFLAQPLASDARGEQKTALKTGTEAAKHVTENVLPEQPLAPGPGETIGKTPPPASQSPAGPSVSEISAVAEELIGRLESHLQQHIRAVVESMLPGLVRSIIDEELAKLKEKLE